MPRATSDIFENYIKLAQEQGIAPSESKELKHYKEDPEAKVEGRDAKDIAALYHIKPEMIEGLDYEHTIMEAAHREPFIVSPAYDNLNGLVENHMERSNIMSNIALGPTCGNHTNHKYARQELMMELVRVANEMDANNQDELRKLADGCIQDLHQEFKKKIKKEGLAPLAIAGLIAASLAATWLLGHTNSLDRGLITNCERALEKLNDLKTNSWYESDVDDTVQAEADRLIELINALKEEVVQFNKVSDIIFKPRTLTELQDLVKLKNDAIKNGSSTITAITKFKKAVASIHPALTQAIENFTSTVYQNQHSKPSWLSNISDYVSEGLHGRYGLIPNDFISAASALTPLQTSLEEASKRIDRVDAVTSKYEEQVQKAMNNVGLGQDTDIFKQDTAHSPASTVHPAVPFNDKGEKTENLPQQWSEKLKSQINREPTKNELDFFKNLFE